MSGAEIATLITALVALGGVVVQWFRTPAEVRHTKVEGDVKLVTAADQLMGRYEKIIKDLEARLESAERREQQLMYRVAELEREVAQLRNGH